ncbi:MAG: HDOD domain-containing protein [Pseudomonadaceae bacterium]|nr:HDOD domain-containing protein [Pseudomonadaceae bacterium]
MSQAAQAIHDQVKSAIASDELDLPTLPEVALKIREVAEDDDVSAAALVDVVADDPSLSAQLVKLANSPMFRATRPIEDLHMAISRIGVVYAANVATGLAMQQMFQATSDMIDRKMREIWNHATQVAAIAGVLAKHYSNLSPDQATLGGLLHNIGTLPILAWAEEHGNLIPDSMTLDRVIDSMHGSLGTMILTSWEFPVEIAGIPNNYLKFDRNNSDTDYIDIVIVANIQARQGSGHPHGEIDPQSVQAFANLGLDNELPEEDEEDLSAELEAAMAVFK